MEEKNLHTTLVPIDFSQASLVALDHAAALANIIEGENQKITLLHVLEGSSFRMVTDDVQLEEHDRDALAIEGAMNRLKKVAEKFSERSNAKFHCIVSGGKPYKEIAQVAEETQADIIVMGTHGSSGMQAFAGSNASKVIQIAPCPVAVIREKTEAKGCKNIVLPLDFTAETKQKVNAAVKIAQYYKATIHILCEAVSDEFLMAKVHGNLNQVKMYLDERGIPNTTDTLPSGNFGKHTIAWAQGHDADLIVIMSEQEGGLASYLFGTTAQQIVNRSPIPVMAITPREDLTGVFEGALGTNAFSH